MSVTSSASASSVGTIGYLTTDLSRLFTLLRSPGPSLLSPTSLMCLKGTRRKRHATLWTCENKENRCERVGSASGTGKNKIDVCFEILHATVSSTLIGPIAQVPACSREEN
ncbi:hypothetical protein YC2023_064389 [Brassica napus]